MLLSCNNSNGRLHVVCFLVLLLLVTIGAEGQCYCDTPTTRSAVQTIYNDLGGPRWPRNFRIDFDNPDFTVCSLFFMGCNWYMDQSGGVQVTTSLYFGYNFMRGTISSAAIGNLTNLTSFEISTMNVRGAIPATLCNAYRPPADCSYCCYNRTFSLYYSSITSIPNCLWQTVENLYFYYGAALIAEFLQAPTAATPSSVRYLTVYDSRQAAWTLPASWCNALANLSTLEVSYSPLLTGTIPSCFFDGLAFPMLSTMTFNYCPNLSGTLPSLSNWQSMTQLTVSECGLTGTIPASYANLTYLALQYLPNLTGTVPAELCATSGSLLYSLSLAGSGITALPACVYNRYWNVQVAETTKLEALPERNLSAPIQAYSLNVEGSALRLIPEWLWCSLTVSLSVSNLVFYEGTIPSCVFNGSSRFSRFSSSLYFYNITFRGTLPQATLASSLNSIELQYLTELTGPIPSTWGLPNYLQCVTLRDVPKMTASDALCTFGANYGQITIAGRSFISDRLPNCLFNQSRNVYLNSMEITVFPEPTVVSPWFSYLELYNITSESSLPASWCATLKVGQIRISESARWSATLPDCFLNGSMASLTYLDIQNTPLFRVNISSLNTTQLYSMTVISTAAFGTLPASLPSSMNLYTLQVRNNRNVTGSIPSSFCASNIYNLYLSNNSLTGTIPYCFWGTIDRSLNFQDNDLNGTFDLVNITASTRGYAQSRQFIVSNNPRLKVVLNESFCNQTMFYYIDLSYVDLQLGPQGTLPRCLFQYESFRYFLARGNRIQGAVPDLPPPIYEGQPRLDHLDLSDNQLSLFPQVIHPISCTFNLRNNSLRGTLPKELLQYSYQECYDCDYYYYATLDFSMNFLEGSLPTNISDSYVYVLNLSSNRFTGTLSQIVNGTIRTPRLNVLDVSYNQLTGTLPEDWLDQQSSLSAVYLHGNQIHGTLPSYWSSSFRYQKHSWRRRRYFYLLQLCSPTMPYLLDNQFCGSTPSMWALDNVLSLAAAQCTLLSQCTMSMSDSVALTNTPSRSSDFTTSRSVSVTRSGSASPSRSMSVTESTSLSEQTPSLNITISRNTSSHSSTPSSNESSTKTTTSTRSLTLVPPPTPEPTSGTTAKLEEASSVATSVVSGASLLAAADTSTAVMQAMLDVMGCGSGGGGGFGGNATSPASYTISVFFGLGPAASAFGNLGLMACVALLHGGAVGAYSLAKGVALADAAGTLRFPAVPVQVSEFLLSGVVLGSGVLIVDAAAGTRDAWEGVLGGFGLLAVVLLLLGKEALRRVAVRRATWEPRPPQPTTLRQCTVPHGVWMPDGVRKSLGPAFASFVPRFTLLSVTMLSVPLCVSLSGAFGDESSCGWLLWFLASVFFLGFVVVAALRPFRRPLDSLLAALSYLVLSITTSLKAVDERDAVAILGYVQTVLILTRVVAGIVCDRIDPVTGELEQDPMNLVDGALATALFDDSGPHAVTCIAVAENAPGDDDEEMSEKEDALPAPKKEPELIVASVDLEINTKMREVEDDDPLNGGLLLPKSSADGGLLALYMQPIESMTVVIPSRAEPTTGSSKSIADDDTDNEPSPPAVVPLGLPMPHGSEEQHVPLAEQMEQSLDGNESESNDNSFVL